VPVPNRTAVHGTDEVGEEAEGDHEEDEEEEIDGPVDEGGGKGEEEEQGEEDSDCGDDFGVDEALFGGGWRVFLRVQVFACKAGDGGGECKLAEAEREGEGVCHEHLDGLLLWRCCLGWW